MRDKGANGQAVGGSDAESARRVSVIDKSLDKVDILGNLVYLDDLETSSERAARRITTVVVTNVRSDSCVSCKSLYSHKASFVQGDSWQVDGGL